MKNVDVSEEAEYHIQDALFTLSHECLDQWDDAFYIIIILRSKGKNPENYIPNSITVFHQKLDLDRSFPIWNLVCRPGI